MENLIEQIKSWSISHNLNKTDPLTQLAKIVEEVGELARALLKNDSYNIVDSLGDIIIALTILSQQLELDLEKCIKVAYNEIIVRKGYTINGVFIKD